MFDKWAVPSRDAASTDTTKIIRADYPEEIYAKIAGEAIELWKTEFFKGTYHQTGTHAACFSRLLTSGWVELYDKDDSASSQVLETLRKTGLAEGIVEYKGGREVTESFNMIDGAMENYSGYFNPTAVVLYVSQLIPMTGLGKCRTGNVSSCNRCPTIGS